MVLNATRRAAKIESGSDSDTEDQSDQGDETDLLEPGPEFLMRVAQWMDEQLTKASLVQWTVQWKRRKWQWAHRLFGGRHDKWSRVAALWQPVPHSDCASGCRKARPRKRWEQDFVDDMEKVRPGGEKSWHEMASSKDW